MPTMTPLRVPAGYWRQTRSEHQQGEPDAVAVRIGAWVRVGLAIGVAAVGSFLPGVSSRQSALFLVIGLLWLPWACVVLLAADGARSSIATFGGPLGDIAMIVALQSFYPSSARETLVAVALVVAFAAYTGGRTLGAVVASGALLTTTMSQRDAPVTDRVDSLTLTFLALMLGALVLLLDRTSTGERHTAARSARLQGKSDAILARVADGVVVTDPRGRILQCNRAAERIMGLEEVAALGATCHELLALRIGERGLDCSHGCAILAMRAVSDAALGHEVWRLAAGRRQPLLANASAVTDRRGNVLEVVHSLRDVTRLKEADEAKTLFLATASHELKTPLTVIRGFAEVLLGQNVGDEAQSEALDAIHRRAMELTKIVDRLLLSARIEAGHADVSITDVDVTPLLAERAGALEAATGRTLDVRDLSDLPTFAGDRDALMTIVDHLLENAIKYSPDGEPVRLSTTYDDHVIRIEVADQGIGMDAEQITHCFDKFWQAESTDGRRFGGTGIGLFIVRSLVEAMAGRLDVESRRGEGTCFRVTLPRRAPDRLDAVETAGPLMGEPSSIREFMRHIGVPQRSLP